MEPFFLFCSFRLHNARVDKSRLRAKASKIPGAGMPKQKTAHFARIHLLCTKWFHVKWQKPAIIINLSPQNMDYERNEHGCKGGREEFGTGGGATKSNGLNMSAPLTWASAQLHMPYCLLWTRSIIPARVNVSIYDSHTHGVCGMHFKLFICIDIFHPFHLFDFQLGADWKSKIAHNFIGNRPNINIQRLLIGERVHDHEFLRLNTKYPQRMGNSEDLRIA